MYTGMNIFHILSNSPIGLSLNTELVEKMNSSEAFKIENIPEKKKFDTL